MAKLYDQVRDYTVKQVTTQAMKLLVRLSDEDLIKITYLAERLTNVESVRSDIRAAREALKNSDSSWLKLAKRTHDSMCSNALEKLIQNLLINQILLGGTKRRGFEEQYGFHPPFVIVISPTMRCNLNCPGCYAAEYSKKDDLPHEIFDRVLREAKELGIHFITISGGEPFVREDLLDMFAKYNDMYFHVYTNGTFIDREVAHRLAELGNVAPAISIEGYEEETDRRRGKGVYRKVLQAMDNLREEGVPIGASITVTKYNSQVVASEDFVDSLIERGVLFTWYFQYIPIGRNPSVELMSTPEQRNYLRKQVYRMRNEKPILLMDFWNDGPAAGGCIAGGRSYFHINVNGDVEPCVFAHFAVDNIRDKSLAEAINCPFFKGIRRAQKEMKNKLIPCMIIDRPAVLRRLVEEYGAHPTHEDAESIVTKFADFLDKYGAEMKEITDPIWQRYLETGDWREVDAEEPVEVGS